MKCPHCKSSGKGRVIDTRITDDNNAIRRRRHCDNCGERYTTIERFEGLTGSGFAITSTPGELAKLGFGFEKPTPSMVVIEQEPPRLPDLRSKSGPVASNLTREDKRKFIRDLKERMRDAQRAANG